MKTIRAVALSLVTLIFGPAAVAVDFPPGTSQFVNTHSSLGIPAAGGGIWVGTPAGLVRYTASGPGPALPIPGGGIPRNLVMATDGSIWFGTDTLIGRISTTGTILEQYPMASVRLLVVASDGALWYVRDNGAIIGRIAGAGPAEFPAPKHIWSLAPASNGDVWALDSGFGTTPDVLHRITPAGSVTILPLGADVLFGRLRVLSDGTLYVGTGIRRSVLRLTPTGQVVETISLPGSEYLTDSFGNLWTGGHQILGYIDRLGARVSVPMPGDPRADDCDNMPFYLYLPMAIDSTGGLWVRLTDDAVYFPLPLPCNLPEPPPMPDLVRIDTRLFLESHLPGHGIPTLSPAMLIAMAVGLAFVAFRFLRV